MYSSGTSFFAGRRRLFRHLIAVNRMNSVIKKTAQMHVAIMIPKIESDIFVFSLNANVRAYDGDVVVFQRQQQQK